ncbi:MAG: chromosomal replication initiator protein DnaA [Clostridia bacterium]|nr:chromosomal replication initiator protein DnaA [Clostridia bacterium]
MDSYNDLWNLVREYCKEHVTDTIYSLWLEPLQLVSFEDNKVVLSASEFKANIVQKKFMDLLNAAFEATMGPIDIEIISDKAGAEKPEAAAPAYEDAQGNYDLTFDTFVVGSSNKFPHAAALAVANAPGQAYNPLFIWGKPGLGKTHLLNAICAEIKKNQPDAKIIYTSSEDFTNELINSLAQKTMQQFHDKYRTADVLLVDDVQFIGGKASTQEEFFHTFDALIQDNKQIVFTSDRPPKEIQQLEERVKSRFEWGLLADIQPPDIETRMAIILRKAEYCGLSLSNDVVQYIAEKIKNNIRQLEGVVKKLNAQYIISGKEPNLLAAQNAIQDILSDNQPISVQVDNILSEVARTYDTTVDNIKSEKRNANISNARKAAMYIIREVTSLPMEKIGEIFGGKHHSTVIYGINKVEEAMDNDPSVKATIESIINNVQKNNV